MDGAGLKHLLKAHHERLLQLHQALVDEQDALAGRDLAALQGTSEHKLGLARDLESLTASLRTALGLAAECSTADIGAALAKRGQAPAWRAISEQLQRCAARNQSNGLLIELSRSTNNQLLEILRGETGSGHTYGPQGRTEPSNPGVGPLATA